MPPNKTLCTSIFFSRLIQQRECVCLMCVACRADQRGCRDHTDREEVGRDRYPAAVLVAGLHSHRCVVVHGVTARCAVAGDDRPKVTPRTAIDRTFVSIDRTFVVCNSIQLRLTHGSCFVLHDACPRVQPTALILHARAGVQSQRAARGPAQCRDGLGNAGGRPVRRDYVQPLCVRGCVVCRL